MRCPTCNNPVEWQDNLHRPFCSERCKLIDFGRWANEEYRMPAEETQQTSQDEGGRMKDDELNPESGGRGE